MTVGHNLPVPARPRCCIWLSGPGFQDLDKRTMGFTLRTWVSGPWQTHKYRTPKALHPTVILSFSCHFSLRPPSLFSTSSGHIRTDRRTQQATLYIRLATDLGVPWNNVTKRQNLSEIEKKNTNGDTGFVTLDIINLNLFFHLSKKCIFFLLKFE
jgi:hypothetical protein